MLKKLNSRNRFTAIVALLCCLCMLVGVFAFFTDRVTKSSSATAGNMDLVFTDISSSKTGANGITSNNEFAIDKSWDFASLVSDGGIINPGDYFDLSYNLSNIGSKAMDVRQQLTLTSTVPLTEGAEEYTLSITGENYDTVTLTPDPDESTDTVLVYNLSDITLNGSVETENGVSWTDQTYKVRLDFDIDATNKFMDSGVAVSLKAQAKQARNTNDDTDWATWAEYTTKFEEVGGESGGATEVTGFSFIENKGYNNGVLEIVDKTNYMVTDYITCEPGYTYTIRETQNFDGFLNGVALYVVSYDENKEPIRLAYYENRQRTGDFVHNFEVARNEKYFVVMFRMTDTNISITKTKTNNALEYFASGNTQGLAVSEDYIFAGYNTDTSTEAANNYKIRKINRNTGEIVATSSDNFAHTNGMTYNSDTNELIVTATSDKNGTADDDYNLFVVNPDTLELKETIELKDVVLSVDNDSSGILQVAYNANLDEYYIGAGYGSSDQSKYIITLNSDFTMKSSTYIGTKSDIAAGSSVLGNFYVDNNYFYMPVWLNGSGVENVIKIYDKNTGALVDTKSVSGISHIEGIDYIDGRYYLSYIDFESGFAKIYSMPELKDIH